MTEDRIKELFNKNYRRGWFNSYEEFRQAARHNVGLQRKIIKWDRQERKLER